MRTIRVVDGRLRGRIKGTFIVEDGKPGEVYMPDQDVDTVARWYAGEFKGVRIEIERAPFLGNCNLQAT